MKKLLPAHIEERRVEAVLSRMVEATNPGPAQTHVSHLRAIGCARDGLAALVEWCRIWAAGKPSGRIVAIWANGTVVPLLKDYRRSPSKQYHRSPGIPHQIIGKGAASVAEVCSAKEAVAYPVLRAGHKPLSKLSYLKGAVTCAPASPGKVTLEGWLSKTQCTYNFAK